MKNQNMVSSDVAFFCFTFRWSWYLLDRRKVARSATVVEINRHLDKMNMMICLTEKVRKKIEVARRKGLPSEDHQSGSPVRQEYHKPVHQ